MRQHGLLTACALALTATGAAAQQLAPSPTLDAIKARGNVECGVHLGLPGFSFANDKGEWSGPRRRLLQGARRRRARRRQQGQVHADLGAAALADPAIGPGRPAVAQLDHHLLAQCHARHQFPGHQFLRRPDLHRPQRRPTPRRRPISTAPRSASPPARPRRRTRPTGSASATSRSPSSISRRTTTRSPPMMPAAATPIPRASARSPASASSSRSPDDHIILTQPISNDPQGPVTR